MKDKVTVIGIAGGTGSGKTTVVKKLVEVLPPHYVAVVPLDSYYNDTSQMTEEERHQINFDHPCQPRPGHLRRLQSAQSPYQEHMP